MAKRKIGPIPLLMVLVGTISFLPDFDFIPGLIIGDYDTLHNSYSNSFIIGLFLALTAGLFGSITKQYRFSLGFLIVFLTYESHVLMDYLGAGRGTMLFWPITDSRYVSPIQLFYGLHRSDGLWSVRHIWTFLTEVLFAIAVFLIMEAHKWQYKNVRFKKSIREKTPTE